ncbi:MAG TPA: hypothetical protein VIT91_11645 [Chthoniobacterales bacterium]
MIFANVVWPALYLSQRYYSWWAITLSLLIETGVLYGLTRKTFPKCLLLAFAANAVSTLIGFLAFIWIGFAWELIVSYTLYEMIPLGTFNPFGWIATTILAAFFSCTIEWAVIKYLFKIPTTNIFYWLFFAANLVTAAIALITLFTNPVIL